MKTQQMLFLLALILLIFVGKIHFSISESSHSYSIHDMLEFIQYLGMLGFSILMGAILKLKV